MLGKSSCPCCRRTPPPRHKSFVTNSSSNANVQGRPGAKQMTFLPYSKTLTNKSTLAHMESYTTNKLTHQHVIMLCPSVLNKPVGFSSANCWSHDRPAGYRCTKSPKTSGLLTAAIFPLKHSSPANFTYLPSSTQYRCRLFL